MSLVLILMILFPLAGSLVNGLIVRPTAPKRAGVIGTLASALSLACAAWLFWHLVDSKEVVKASFDWFSAGALKVRWGVMFDNLTAVMALVVTGIGTLIHVYSIGYMSEDKSPSRYFAYLNLFLFQMLCLVTADSLPVLFVGWEGVGLCSYLLIGYWYQDLNKSNAGMKAFIVNRIGDAGFLIGMFILFLVFQTLEFAPIRETIATGQPNLRLLNLAAFFLFIGATGKSAQIPLFVWLPDAMAGPTPVSALIHAATMVTAGIYMVARLGFLFEVTATTSLGISIIGVSTALLAALIATSQRDIKKVLAYSTVSQLGLMVLALGQNAYIAALFHVFTHAFFKALLFLGAGSVIHALDGEQDICEMGGLKKHLPKTFFTFAIGTAAICGIPPLSGFFSKDTLLFSVLNGPYGNVFWTLGSLASLLTAFYMTRLFALVFLGRFRGTEKKHPHESPAAMTVPLIILAIGSAVVGFLGVPHGFHWLPPYFFEFLSQVVPLLPEPEASAISEFGAMGIATFLAVLGSGIGLWMYSDPSRSEKPAAKLGPVVAVLREKFYVDELYSLIIIRPFDRISSFLARVFDTVFIDGTVLLSSRLCRAAGTLVSVFQVGSAQFYLLVMLLGTLFVLWTTLKGGGL